MIKYRPFDLRRVKRRLIGASLLVNVVVIASFLTSSELVSPAGAWMTAVYRGYYGIVPVTSKLELRDLHADAMDLTREQCVACHGPMVTSKLVLHRIHLKSELLPGLACRDCHRRVSLEPQTNTKVVRLVDVGVCKKCHSPFITGPPESSPMKPSDFYADCTTCHSGKHAFKHAQPYLSQVIAPRECAGCHGGRVLPWTPAHEKDDWIEKHGPDALRRGVGACNRCHEYGLQFCNDCHRKRPPRHEPKDVWLVKHPARARADTRACFTCHQADYCKRCHVNHARGWLAKHSRDVLDNGAETCIGCHSTTFCSNCHVSHRSGQAPSVAPVGP